MTDYTLEDTVYLPFTSRAFATGVPTTLSGTPVVSAYENDSATQITAGITLGVDHDSVTGLNMLAIAATAANGFENGKDYNLVITTGTVGGVSVVGEVARSFSLGRGAAAVDLANGTDGLTALKTDTAAILVDTSTTLDGKINTIDTNVDAILVDTATTIPGQISGLNDVSAAQVNAECDTAISDAALATAANLATVDTNVDSILVDTATTIPAQISGLNDVSTAQVNSECDTAISDAALATASALATVDTNVDSILVDTGTTIPASISALNDISVSDILTTQMTEAYAADGTAPTLAQAIFLIQQTIGDFAIAGTTITTKKLDGSATAATYTLDDGTNPTSRTRTT